MKTTQASHLSLVLAALALFVGGLALGSEDSPGSIVRHEVHAAERTLDSSALSESGDRPSNRAKVGEKGESVLEGENPTTAAGRVVVQERPGGPFVPLTEGQLLLSCGGVRSTVPIAGGQWQLPQGAASACAWKAHEVWSAGRKLGFYGVEFEPAGKRQVFHAYSYPGGFLVARNDRGELVQDLNIYSNLTGGGRVPDPDSVHPGNKQTLDLYPESQSTPRYLSALPGEPWCYWVEAPGYQWARVPGAWTTEREVLELQLVPGAGLRVFIDDFALQVGLKLTVERGGQRLATYVGVRESVVEFDGLAPGDCQVSLSFDRHYGMDERVLAATGTERLHAGTVRDVRLAMPGMPRASRLGAISGTILLEQPELWSDTGTFAEAQLVLKPNSTSPEFAALRRADRVRSLRGLSLKAGLREFSYSRLPEGQYTLCLAPLGIRYPVTVIGGQTSFLDCSVPSLARTEIEAWCATAPLGDLLIVPLRPGGSGADFELISRARGVDSNRVTLVTLPGELTVLVSPAGMAASRHTLQVRAGYNEQRLELADTSAGSTVESAVPF